jgi:hypothetical protein
VGPNELGNLLFVLTVAVIGFRLASLPFFLWLLKRAHPATVFSALRFLEAFLVRADPRARVPCVTGDLRGK